MRRGKTRIARAPIWEGHLFDKLDDDQKKQLRDLWGEKILLSSRVKTLSGKHDEEGTVVSQPFVKVTTLGYGDFPHQQIPKLCTAVAVVWDSGRHNLTITHEDCFSLKVINKPTKTLDPIVTEANAAEGVPKAVECLVCHETIPIDSDKVWCSSIHGDGYKHPRCAGSPAVPKLDGVVLATKEEDGHDLSVTPTTVDADTLAASDALAVEWPAGSRFAVDDDPGAIGTVKGTMIEIEETFMGDGSVERRPVLLVEWDDLGPDAPGKVDAGVARHLEDPPPVEQPSPKKRVKAKVAKKPVDIPDGVLETVMNQPTVEVVDGKLSLKHHDVEEPDDPDDGITEEEILGLTDNAEASRVMGLPLDFKIDRFIKMVEVLPDIVGLPTNHDARLVAEKIQMWLTDIVKAHAFFEWAYTEAKNNYQNWFSAQVTKAYDQGMTLWQARKQEREGGTAAPIITKPDLAYIKLKVQGHPVTRKYQRAIARYNYWRNYVKRLGIDGLERKSMLTMNINKNTLRIAEQGMANLGDLGKGVDPDALEFDGDVTEDAVEDPLGVMVEDDVPHVPIAAPEEDAPPESAQSVPAGADALDSLRTVSMALLYPWMAEHPEISSEVCDVCRRHVYIPDPTAPMDVRDVSGKSHSLTCKDPIAKLPGSENTTVVSDDDIDFLEDVEEGGEATPPPTTTQPPTTQPITTTTPITPDTYQNEFDLDDIEFDV